MLILVVQSSHGQMCLFVFLLTELMEKRAQVIRTGKAPVRTFKDRYITATLWLSNNLLNSMEGLQRLADRVLDDPAYLSWLDLSFNEINEIGEDIEKFTNLKILYLHGNKIANIADTLKLRKLQNRYTVIRLKTFLATGVTSYIFFHSYSS